jgi:hypothetical protein
MRMSSIQGTIVPKFYGVAEVAVEEGYFYGEDELSEFEKLDEVEVLEYRENSTMRILPSIGLEYIVGEDLHTHKIERDELPQYARAIEACCIKVGALGVAQMDPRCDGLIVTPVHSIKMTDFSHVDSVTDYALGAKSSEQRVAHQKLC